MIKLKTLFIGSTTEGGRFLEVLQYREILRNCPLYQLTDIPGSGIHVRPLSPNLSKTLPEEAIAAADLVIQLGQVSLQLQDLIKGKPVIPVEDYVAEVSQSTAKTFTLPCSMAYFPDIVRECARLHEAGYSFILSSTDPELAKYLAFTNCTTGTPTFSIFIKPDESALNIRRLRKVLTTCAQQSLSLSLHIGRLRELFRVENWQRNIFVMPGDDNSPNVSIRLSLSLRTIELSRKEFRFVKWLSEEKVTQLPEVNRTSVENLARTFRHETKLADDLDCLMSTRLVKIANIDNVIISFIGSRRCNLRCRYCFSEHSCPEDNATLTSSDIVKICDIITDGRHDPEVHFDNGLGGEPACEAFDVANRANACMSYHKTSGIRSSFGLLTNATMMSQSFLDWLKCHIPYVGFSMDGDPETHNRLRPDFQGKPSHHKAVKGIRMLQNADWPVETGISSVISKYNLDIKALREYMISVLKIRNIVMKPVRASQEADYALTYKDLPALTESYKALFAWMFTEAEKGNMTPLFSVLQPLDYAGRFMLRVFHNDRLIVKRCGAGEHIFSINNKSEIFPCDSFNGVIALGSKNEGLNNSLGFRVPFVSEENPAFGCGGCWARFLCGGVCQYVQHLNHREHNDVTRQECELSRSLIEESITFWASARKAWPKEIIEKVSTRIREIGFLPLNHNSLVYAPC